VNRRSFLHRSSLGSLGSLATASALGRLAQVASAQSAPSSPGYKALVCVFLNGGNDSFNMLMPQPAYDSGTEWSRYLDLRQGIAGPKLLQQRAGYSSSDLTANTLSLFDASSQLQPQALSATMPRLAALFNATALSTPGGNVTPSGRHAAFLRNVGTLVEPLTPQQAIDGTKRVPLSRFSHADQISQWQSLMPQSTLRSGWGGRLIERAMANFELGTSAYRLISLAGSNLMLTGDQVSSFSDPGNSGDIINSLTTPGNGTPMRARGDLLRQLVDVADEDAQTHPLYRAYTAALRSSLDDNSTSSTNISGAPNNLGVLTANSGNNLMNQLRRVARLIYAYMALDHAAGTGYTPVRRQVFFVQLGGWDHHDGLDKSHPAMLESVDEAVADFYLTLRSMEPYSGATPLSNVTLFTASDFGRSLMSNGNGSDHAWGGHHFAVGGAVKGGLYGTYPGMLRTDGTGTETLPNRTLDVSGVMVPSTSLEQYLYPMADWFTDGSLSPTDWTRVFPNFANFTYPTTERFMV